MAHSETFDVFLSYSRADMDAVRQVQSRLREAGLATFLDYDQLPAGQPWLSALEQAIAHCGAVAVLIGPTGLGTWQQREVQLALDRQAEAERAGRSFPVIPILLPKVEDPPGGFLRLQTWVDLRSDLADPTQLHLLLSSIRGHGPANGSALREAFCPYRGLLPFREEDAGLFFGREREIEELVDKLRHHNFATLVGRSGSGKSSVVYAGLIPALRRRADGRTWSVVSLRPGPEPLHALVRAFDPPPADLPPFEADRRIEQQVEILRTMDGALGRRVRGLLAGPDERGTERLLLHVDQWEELYTQALRRPASTPERAEADVVRFIDLLLDATRTSPCTVVLTVRADFYGELLKHGPLAAAMSPGQVNLGPMRREGLAAAIQEPARAVGLTVDPPLLDELLNKVCDDLGKLPLLEYALKETWRGREGKRLTLNAYGRAGRIDGAVAKRANEIFAQLKPAEQAAARRLFVSLVTPGEGREDTRARALYPEQDDAIRAVIHEFSAADARLLVTGADVPTAQHLVEISHEALIREWGLLREWIEANREALRHREHIRARMRQWEEQGRDATLLLSPGLPLEEGRKLLGDHGDVLIEEIAPYIEASIAADKERLRQAAHQRRRRARMAAAGFMLVTAFAVFAGRQWHVARQEKDRAERYAAAEQQEKENAEREKGRAEVNFAAAKQTVDDLIVNIAQGLQNVAEMRAETVQRILDAVERTITRLAASAPDDLDLQRSRSAMLNEFGDVYRRIGDLARAQQAYEASLAIRDQLARSDPRNAQLAHDVAVTWTNIGNVLETIGRPTEALRAYGESLAIARRLAAADPANSEWQHSLTIGYNNVGDVLFTAGRYREALENYRESLAIREKLAAADPSNARWQRALTVSYNYVGDVLATTGRLEEALDAYRKSHAIREKLAAADPGNAQWQRDLAFSYDRTGGMLEVAGSRDEALDAYGKSHAIRKKLAAADPGNAQWQRDLTFSYDRIGGVLEKSGRREAALDSYGKSLAIREKLVAADRSNTRLQRDLAVSYDRIGSVLATTGRREAALDSFGKSLAIREKLAAADPGNAEWQNDLRSVQDKIHLLRDRSQADGRDR